MSTALAVLERLARQEVERERRVLLAIDQALDALAARRDALAAQAARETAGLDDDRMLPLLVSFQTANRRQRKALAAEQAALARQRARQQETLVQCRLALRRLQIVRERRAERQRAAAARAAQQTIDELALQPFARRGQSTS